MKYYIIAGEASGDMHGAGLMEALARADSSARFRFWGGEKMAAVGGAPVRDYRQTAVMGVAEVILKAGKVSRNLSFCKKDIAAWSPDAVILIDYPGFNLRIAKYAHCHGFKVIYYIAPKVWATREGRVRKLRRWVDRLLVILPFEQDYFKRHGIDAIYVGNPVVDSLAGQTSSPEDTDAFLDSNALPHKPYIALLPGSRKMEVSYTLPVFRQLEKKLAAGGMHDYQLLVAAAPSIDDSVYTSYLEGSSIRVVRGHTSSVIRHAAAAVVDSGTASLETALLGIPQVVVYGMSPFSFLFVRLLLKTKYVSLANLILDKEIFKELLQENCTADKIFPELRRLVCDQAYRDAMQADYARLRQVIGEAGASDKAAMQVLAILQSSIEE